VAGDRLAELNSSAEANRYGRSRSAENCNEVLSDSLKEAFATALSDRKLQAAWTSGKATQEQPAEDESTEGRLRKLENLYKKGLITKEEYEAKRAEILRSV
jgi:hypothetical protein